MSTQKHKWAEVVYFIFNGKKHFCSCLLKPFYFCSFTTSLHFCNLQWCQILWCTTTIDARLHVQPVWKRHQYYFVIYSIKLLWNIFVEIIWNKGKGQILERSSLSFGIYSLLKKVFDISKSVQVHTPISKLILHIDIYDSAVTHFAKKK